MYCTMGVFGLAVDVPFTLIGAGVNTSLVSPDIFFCIRRRNNGPSKEQLHHVQTLANLPCAMKSLTRASRGTRLG